MISGPLPGGATLLGPNGAGWVLIDDGSPSTFGAAMAWAVRRGVRELKVLVDGDEAVAGIVARRAALFDPVPEVFVVRGRSLLPVSPAAPPPEPDLPSGAEGILEMLSAHGIDPVVEHGVAKGEVLGLEIARVVAAAGEARLEVGVGSHDRQARVGLRPDQEAGAALDEVLELVRRWRSPGARRHPANILARERWLRSVVVARPEIVGARWLQALPPVLASDDLRRPQPAAAAGQGGEGEPLVVVCSTGVDPDLVPTAADHRLLDGRGARLRLVVPAGDDYPLTRELAAALAEPAEVVTVPRDWPALLG